MPTKKKSRSGFQAIDATKLEHVTGGITGAGPGAPFRRGHELQQAANPWAQFATWQQPARSVASVAPRSDGQAGTPGTPGAWVHSGKFRPL